MAPQLIVSIEFTEREADIAVALFDLAVRAQGIAVAENALLLTRKLKTPFTPQPPAPPAPPAPPPEPPQPPEAGRLLPDRGPPPAE